MTTVVQKNFFQNLTVFVFSLALLAAGAQAVLAADPPPGDQSGGVLGDIQKSAITTGSQSGAGLVEGDLQPLVARIIKSFLAILGTVAIVLIIYAGYLWMTAAGNEEQISKAKKLIANAVIGLIIILAAYSIATFIINSIVKSSTGAPPAAP